MDGEAWWAEVHGVVKSWTRLSDFTFTFHFHALGKKMATHSNALAWRIPGTGEPGGLPSLGSHRVRHYWSDLAAAAAAPATTSQSLHYIHGSNTLKSGDPIKADRDIPHQVVLCIKTEKNYYESLQVFCKYKPETGKSQQWVRVLDRHLPTKI